MANLIISLSLIYYFIFEVKSHGMMLEPPNRSSIWRFPEFSSFNPNVNNRDNETFCGGFMTQHMVNNGSCGVCGDPFNQPQPRDNEDGGKYGKGIIVRTYTAGQVIPIQVNLTFNHFGFFEIRLCGRDDIKSHLKQSCYDKHLLKLVDYERPPGSTGTNSKFYVDTTERTVTYHYNVKLPRNVRCQNCVLQWHWRAAHREGQCSNGQFELGCGPQETYGGCADIAIE